MLSKKTPNKKHPKTPPFAGKYIENNVMHK